MYQVTRKNRIKEQLQLCHADGSVALTADVDLNVDKIAARVNKAFEVLGMAQNALQNDPRNPETLTAYGNAVAAVFAVIFGEENAAKIAEFYENNYTEMLLDISPFINDHIMPQIREARAQRREQLIAASKAAKRSGKQRLF